MLVGYVGFWAMDSFILRLTAYRGLISWPLTVVGVAILISGVYLVRESHRLVIESEILTLVEQGVYGLSRHPMYLGIMLVYLGLASFTLSAFALVVWLVVFIIYDRLAAYEENDLEVRLGDKYAKYKSKVKRWLLF
jgi:protein-S-isoprenylcysteine O-methyltransferase Ste14